jgi:hypothetical protein
MKQDPSKCRYTKGTALQLAQKLGFRVGRGFIPGTNVTKSSWALAPEVRLSILSSPKQLIATEVSQSAPQGLKSLRENQVLYQGTTLVGP